VSEVFVLLSHDGAEGFEVEGVFASLEDAARAVPPGPVRIEAKDWRWPYQDRCVACWLRVGPLGYWVEKHELKGTPCTPS
jgi:hypothetical protein